MVKDFLLMDIRKLKVAILFGGKSAEHEISIQSARSVYNAIDKDKYEIVLIGIDKCGRWFLNDDSRLLEGSDNGGFTDSKAGGDAVSILPGEEGQQLWISGDSKSVGKIDVVHTRPLSEMALNPCEQSIADSTQASTTGIAVGTLSRKKRSPRQAMSTVASALTPSKLRCVS